MATKYRRVKVVLEIRTAASLEYLRNVDEWRRVFRWATPGHADSSREDQDIDSHNGLGKFDVFSVSAQLTAHAVKRIEPPALATILPEPSHRGENDN